MSSVWWHGILPDSGIPSHNRGCCNGCGLVWLKLDIHLFPTLLQELQAQPQRQSCIASVSFSRWYLCFESQNWICNALGISFSFTLW